MKNSTDSGKLIGALLIGTAIGGILGVLFAPAKGSETRKKIAGKSEPLTNVLRENYNDVIEEVKTVKNKAHELVWDGKSKV